MIAIRDVVALLAFGAVVVACATAQKLDSARQEETLVGVGFSRGHAGGFGLELRGDGLLRFWEGGAEPSQVRLSSKELKDLRDFLVSPSAKTAAEKLRSSGYRTGRSDLPEVGIAFGSEELGYPVCSQSPANLAAEVQALVAFLNQLGRKHFRSQWKVDVPIVTCVPGQHL